MFQIVVSSFVEELNHQVCSVPRAGSAGHVSFKGLQSVKVWAAVEPARAARAATVKKFLIVGGKEIFKDIEEDTKIILSPSNTAAEWVIPTRKR
jgi:hypothetical protein